MFHILAVILEVQQDGIRLFVVIYEQGEERD